MWCLATESVGADFSHARQHKNRQVHLYRTAISKNIPVETRLIAIASSHAEATYASTCVHLVRIASPTIISMTPMMCISESPVRSA